MYGTYQRFSYNTCPIRFPVGKAAKMLLFVFVFALMVVAGVAVFAAVHMVAVTALSVLAGVFAAITAVLAVVAQVVAVVVAVAVHAALYALACAVRAAVLVALCRVLPVVVRVLWRLAVMLWAHRDGIALAAKALCFAAVVVGCFVVALVWTPVVLTACCTVLPQTSIATIVLGGAVATVKGM